MLGLLLKVSSGQLPNIQNKKTVRNVHKEAIHQIRALRRDYKDAIAIIGIEPSLNRYHVILTSILHTISANQQGLSLRFVRTYSRQDRWPLPIGLASSLNFTKSGWELLEDEATVLSCLVRTPADLIKNAPPRIPFGFMWNPVATASLIISFDKGAPILYSRQAFVEKTVRDFDNYTKALDHVWARMSGEEFEMAIKELFECMGYKVQRNRAGGGDGGIDLMLTREDSILGDDTYAVQCKNFRLGQKVDAATVRNLRGAAPQSGAQRAIVVTSSSFSSTAQHEATLNGVPIQLIDGT